MDQASRRQLRGWQVWAISFAIAAALLLVFFTRNPQLYDNDAYYHLAIGRAYWQEGLIDDLRWTRFSAMHEGFGDKEVLFHLLLAPFAGLARDPVRGGQVALAVLLAALFATLSTAARRALGSWAILLPWWLALSSTELAWRWVRLRPELLSLLLFVCALQAIARRRYRLLGVVAALYALSYTAFHAFLGICVLIFLFVGWSRRRWEWSLPAYAIAGAGVGLLVHPHFPKNLEIWVLQTFEFFRYRSLLDVGSEITPNYTDVTLMVNLGWALGLVVLWLSSRPRATAPVDADADGELDHRLAQIYGVAAVAFSILYLLMSRFSIYAIPFVTLWALAGLRASGREIGPSTRLPWSRTQVPLALAAALCVAVSAPEALRQWTNYDLRTQAGPDEIRLRDREAFSQALPAGAKVAAPWQQTSIYMLWAPQALYLNVLDPVFLAARDPARHAAQAAVFSGNEPDVPLAVAVALESEYLAYSPYAGLDLLTARLEHDPRVAIRHRQHGFNLLWQVLPRRNDAFVLDWIELHTKKGETPTALDPGATGLRRYPRWPVAGGASLEAYVDTRRLDQAAGCIDLAHVLNAAEAAQPQFELAPWGPTTAWLNGNLVASLGGETQAVLGRGVTFALDLVAGTNLLTVRTCTGKDGNGPRGFYLRRLNAQPAQ